MPGWTLLERGVPEGNTLVRLCWRVSGREVAHTLLPGELSAAEALRHPEVAGWFEWADWGRHFLTMSYPK